MPSITRTLIVDTMKSLAKKRVAFWSEADFQFALACELRSKLGAGAKIYLERPIVTASDTYYVDIWIKVDNVVNPIELKYATKSAEIIDKDKERISTSEQVAYDITRFLYLYDIHRIEEIKKDLSFGKTDLKFGVGFAIILTSDANYYKLQRNPEGTLDEGFRIHEGNDRFNQTVQWNNKDKKADHWTKIQKPYNATPTLATKIQFNWELYSTVKNELKNSPLIYKFLVNEIL